MNRLHVTGGDTGITMSQTQDFENRRDEQQHTYSNAQDLNHVSNYGILCLNGVRVKCNGNKKVSPKGNKAKYSVNGYVNHGYRRTHDKVVDQREHDQGQAGCAVETVCADKVRVLKNGLRSLQNAAGLLVEGKKLRRRRKPRNKKSNLNNLPPLEEEDWEKDVSEVPNRGEHSEAQPYGPEDIAQQVLESLRIHHTDSADLPMSTSNYVPSACHPRPVPRLRSWSSTEADQFADAD
ncbi:uncharacterized protein LOC128754583 [Synchiropus splendidus]|uniref:uncharacterized protein LOC128754583 n=1 Tax=Synchiropus splendidus TaxID=270530 RepID=UPI00237EADF0|nr:uncharacterized protein LOC128754583 [Synchiropus splendidus]